MNFIRFVHLSAYFLSHLTTTAQKTSLNLSKRHWECFMRAASFLLECTLHELIYLYLNNVWSYRHGIRIWLSLVSNKPVTATTTRLLSSREVIQQTTHGDRKKQREHENLWEHSSQQGGNPHTKSPTPSLSSFRSLLHRRSRRGLWSRMLADVYKELILPEQSNGGRNVTGLFRNTE